MNSSVNIQETILLVNNKKTTIANLYEFVYNDLLDFQKIQEKNYSKKVKQKSIEYSKRLTDVQLNQIFAQMQKELNQFVENYSKKSIDKVLDAMNENQFKTKKGPKNLLTLLSSLEEKFKEYKSASSEEI